MGVDRELTGRWCLDRRMLGGFTVMVQFTYLHKGREVFSRPYWRKATKEDIESLGILEIHKTKQLCH